MQFAMGLLARPEPAVASPTQQRVETAVDSGETTEESKFRTLFERLVEKPKAKEANQAVVTDDLWAKLVLLFPQLLERTYSGEDPVIAGTVEELNNADQISGELLAKLAELAAEDTTATGEVGVDEATVVAASILDMMVAEDSTLGDTASTVGSGVEIMPDPERTATDILVGDDHLTAVASTSEPKGALPVAALSSASVKESEPAQAGIDPISQQAELVEEQSNGFGKILGFETDRQMEVEEAPIPDQSVGAQDPSVTVETVSDGAENEFMVTPEHSSESKFVKTEFETSLNAVPTVNPVPSEVADTPELAKTAETTSPVVTKEVLVSQIINGAKLMMKNGVTKIQIQLEPAELGKLELSLVLERDLVAARFVTETQGVQSLIESNLTQLRSSLEEVGLSVELLQVGVQTGTEQQNHAPSGDEQQERNARWAVSPSRLYGVEEEVFAEEAWHGMVNIRA